MSFNFIIFDLDGTLIDSKKDICDAVKFSLEVFGVEPPSDDIIYEFTGDGVRPLIEKVIKDKFLANWAMEVLLWWYDANLLRTTKLFDGIEGVLKTLKKEGKKMIVVSNKRQSFSEKILEGLGVSWLFDGIFGWDSFGVRKPDSKIVVKLRNLFNFSEETLIVGDSPHDVKLGKGYGMRTCVVLWGFRVKYALPLKPDYTVKVPEELLEIILK